MATLFEAIQIGHLHLEHKAKQLALLTLAFSGIFGV